MILKKYELKVGRKLWYYIGKIEVPVVLDKFSDGKYWVRPVFGKFPKAWSASQLKKVKDSVNSTGHYVCGRSDLRIRTDRKNIININISERKYRFPVTKKRCESVV